MKLSRADFPIMRRSILFIVSSLTISAIISISTNHFAMTTERDMLKARNALIDSRKRLASAHEDQNNMELYSDEYRALSENRIIGDGPRLDWMEGMELLHRRDLVSDFSYNIAPQRKYVSQPPIDSGNYDINFSEMKLHFDLLHEGQLLDFFSTLRNQIKGRYQIESCSVKRVDRTHVVDTATTNLNADCKGGWITLKNRSASQ